MTLSLKLSRLFGKEATWIAYEDFAAAFVRDRVRGPIDYFWKEAKYHFPRGLIRLEALFWTTSFGLDLRFKFRQIF